jgi:hypothetical protein
VDYQRFYRELFAPLEAEIGPIDQNTIFAIIGFDCGGPLSFSTIGADRGEPVITYITCELPVREQQVPSQLGRYELLCSCDDEQWVRSRLTDLGRMSLNTEFGDRHSVDLGVSVGANAPLQGVVFETQAFTIIDDHVYAVFRVIGVTRAEMEFKRTNGFEALIAKLKAAKVYPHTLVSRASVV